MSADTSFLSQIQLFAQLDDDERSVLATTNVRSRGEMLFPHR